MQHVLIIMVPCVLVLSGLYVARHEQRMKVQAKLYDLTDDEMLNAHHAKRAQGLLMTERLVPVVLVAICIVIQSVRGASIGTTIASSLIAGAVGVLIAEQIKKRKAANAQKAIDYFLPLVMERVVMAAEAGLDILPAIKAVVSIEQRQHTFLSQRHLPTTEDPVSRALTTVLDRTEKGQQFEVALREVATQTGSLSLQHAFVHLGIAYREGGELIGPLRELSDATQAQYQDAIEEELAKLPVKATAPLVLTFAGLILFFLSSPLIQILSFASKATPK